MKEEVILRYLRLYITQRQNRFQQWDTAWKILERVFKVKRDSPFQALDLRFDTYTLNLNLGFRRYKIPIRK